MAKTARRTGDTDPRDRQQDSAVIVGAFGRDLTSRRTVEVTLPEFLWQALEARVQEANEDDLAADQPFSLNDYIESELINLVTLRDVAQLEAASPGFALAVQSWLKETS